MGTLSSLLSIPGSGYPVGSVRAIASEKPVITFDGGTYLRSGVVVPATEVSATVASLNASSGELWYGSRYGSATLVSANTFSNGSIAVCFDDGTIGYSTDGVVWNGGILPSGFGFNGTICHDGTKLVVVTNGLEIFTSSDAKLWTKISVLSVDVSSSENPAIAYNGTYFVVVTNKAAYKSTDLVTWTSVTRTFATTGKMVYASGRFVGLVIDGVIVSTDGVVWNTYTTGIKYPKNIRYLNGRFVVMGNLATSFNSRIAYSTDGAGWTLRTGLGDYNTNQYGSDVLYDGTKYVLVSGSIPGGSGTGTIFTTSADLDTFESVYYSDTDGRRVNASFALYFGGKCWLFNDKSATTADTLTTTQAGGLVNGDEGVLYFGGLDLNEGYGGLVGAQIYKNRAAATSKCCFYRSANGIVFTRFNKVDDIGAFTVVNNVTAFSDNTVLARFSADGSTYSGKIIAANGVWNAGYIGGSSSLTLLGMQYDANKDICTVQYNDGTNASVLGFNKSGQTVITHSVAMTGGPGEYRGFCVKDGSLITAYKHSVGGNSQLMRDDVSLLVIPTQNSAGEIRFNASADSALWLIGRTLYRLSIDADSVILTNTTTVVSILGDTPGTTWLRYANDAWYLLSQDAMDVAKTVYRSTDGITWKPSAHPWFSDMFVNDSGVIVCHDKNGYVGSGRYKRYSVPSVGMRQYTPTQYMRLK